MVTCCRKLIWYWVLVGLFIAGCTTKNTDLRNPVGLGAEDEKAVDVYQVKRKTIVPDKFPSRNITSGKSIILVPKIMLNLGSITRTKAELREGPGTKYLLLNKILEKDALVLIFDTKASWVKVLDYETEQTGWLHTKTVAKVMPDAYNMKLDVKKLQTVITLKKISRVFTYPQEEAIRVNIPKGYQFVVLKKTRWRVLVWLSETDSVMWISRKEIG